MWIIFTRSKLKITSRRTFRIEIMRAFRKLCGWLIKMILKCRHKDLSIVIQPLTDFPIEIEDSIDFECQFYFKQSVPSLPSLICWLVCIELFTFALFLLSLVPIVLLLTFKVIALHQNISCFAIYKFHKNLCRHHYMPH